MRFSHLLARGAWSLTALLTLSTAFPNYTQVPTPDLDFSQVGRVALTGKFDSISVYEWIGQTEISASTNGSQSLFAQLPNGAFQTLVTSDGAISAMCPFIRKDGTLFGVIVGGNFTSLSGTPAQGIALFNVTNNEIVPLPGIHGSVNAIYCNQETDSVYVGGDFQAANSTNAIAWLGSTGWVNLPFSGFNSPVYTVTQGGNGNVLWGGGFSGLGNMSVSSSADVDEMQVINLSTANISAGSSSSTSGFSDPQNIVCKTSGTDGAGSTWLLQDTTPGYWQADFNFGFVPAKIRLWNTRQDGRGTKTWRFSPDPSGAPSILKLNYTDPATGEQAQCDQTCPLSNNASVEYQDFTFVNNIGMNSFRISISDWYGNGGGLDGVEVFTNDIFSYAVPAFNEPACSALAGGSNATSAGPWETTPSGGSSAEYLTARLTGPGVNAQSASVTFYPDIKQSGNYTVIIYTPGCLQDNNCDRRGIANITGTLSANGQQVSAEVYQTNNYDKYDQIYTGYVDTSTDGSFRPSITLQPLSNQNNSIDLVALRVGFQLLDASSVGLNGLYDYDPLNATAMTQFKESKIDTIGTNLEFGAKVNSLLNVNNLVYVGGRFYSANTSNFIVIDQNNNSMTIPGAGLNGPVASQSNLDNVVYIGGNFTNTNGSTVTGLNNVATFDASRMVWGTLGTGVDGSVSAMVPITIMVDSNQEQCMSVNGEFQNVLTSNNHPSFAAEGFAIWVPSKNEWLKNLGWQTNDYSGQITAQTNLTIDGQVSSLMSGTIVDQGLAQPYAVQLYSNGTGAMLNSTGLMVQQSSSSSGSLQKRDTSSGSSTVDGIYAGYFDIQNNRNLTVLGGHFTATGSDGSNITNLAIVNNTNNQAVTGFSSGIDANSTFRALYVSGDILYAGGQITGTVGSTAINGFVAWNLASSQFNSTLPPALGGSNVSVAAISTIPSGSDLYVAGNFQSAGGLGCPGVCVFSNGQWARPGTSFSGNVSGLLWQGSTKLLAVGNLTVQNTATSAAVYDTSVQSWSIPNNAGNIPGSVTALAAASADGTQYWIAGQATNGSAFLIKYDGTNFQPAPQLDSGSIINGLSVFSLTSGHDSTALVDSMYAVLITGSLNVQPLGNVSGALFNGTNYTPFLLTNSGNNPGSLSTVITESSQNFSAGGGHLAVGFVVLIALAIALGLIFLLILIGLLIERRRRAAEGYRPAPQNYFEKTANMGRIPPERLFGNLNTSPTPRV